MMGYLVISALITFLGALIVYAILQRMLHQQRLTPRRSKGLFVVILALWVFVASALDYVVASPSLITLSLEQKVVPMMLVNACIVVFWLFWGALHLITPSSEQQV